MKVLVLGGAGYIGSHVVQKLIHLNYEVIVVDNLMTGHSAAVSKSAHFYQGDIRNKSFLKMVFAREKIDSVMHFAASSLVEESVQHPLKYFNNNVYGTQVLLECMQEAGIEIIVFSSSAAVYGEVDGTPIYETASTHPTNPYGESKLMMEMMMKWCDKAYGMRYVALRYFNVIGAQSDALIGEDHNPETHLLPLILQVALGYRTSFQLYGDDYDTVDGTCIRDYIHVEDLADAHILALKYLIDGNESNIFNLGNNKGFSVKELLDAARIVTKHPIPVEIVARRSGDPKRLIASSEKAKKILGWQPKYKKIEVAIQTAWTWHQANSKGFNNRT